MTLLSSLFSKKFDVITIGDITVDTFIRLKEADVHCKVNTEDCMLSIKFGDKIPYEEAYNIPGVGNSANAAVSLAKLGLRTAFIGNIGNDSNGDDCIETLRKNNVHTPYVIRHHGRSTNHHYVLWYGAERTILVKHQTYPYSLPEELITQSTHKTPSWVYLSSLGAASESFHHDIAEWLEMHPNIKVAFQPGTFQMRLGVDKLKKIYARTNVFIVNVEEAQRILGSTSTKISELLKSLAKLGPKIVCITDGPKGAYMYDTTNTEQSRSMCFMPPYPDQGEPYERTGCGDAFASTFVAAMALGKTPLEALVWAPINPMSVVLSVGAQKGLLTQQEIENWLSKKPDTYKPQFLSE